MNKSIPDVKTDKSVQGMTNYCKLFLTRPATCFMAMFTEFKMEIQLQKSR